MRLLVEQVGSWNRFEFTLPTNFFCLVGASLPVAVPATADLGIVGILSFSCFLASACFLASIPFSFNLVSSPLLPPDELWLAHSRSLNMIGLAA